MSEQLAEVMPGVGHNLEANLPSIDDINAKLEMANIEALKRVEDLVAKGADFYTITSDADDSAATQFMVANRARWKASEADRVAAKAPYDDRASVVQQFFKTKILDRLADVGAKINAAQTAFKLKKADDEKRAREAEAKRLREVEEQARLEREREAKRVREAEEAARREREVVEKARRDEEDRLRREAQESSRKAREESERIAAEASRKRNADTKAAAEIAAAAARIAAAEAEENTRKENERIANERAERDRIERAENERIAQEREERAEAARLEESRLAEQRAEAEEHANVSMADLSRNRGEKGGVSSLRSKVDVRDIDREKLDYSMLGPYFKDPHVEQALKAYADANKSTVQTAIKTGRQPITGAVFYENFKSTGRA